VPRDLEAICLKCLEKNPERRFAGASELADALDRFLKGEDVPAARLSSHETARRWVRRNPALASRLAILATCVSVLCVTSAISGSFYYSKTLNHIHLGHLSIVFVVWLALSWVFQRFIRRERGIMSVPYVWAIADVAILTTTLVLTDSLLSPIDIGFPLLVAASGLWLRNSLVWFTVACAVIGYALGSAVLLAEGPIDQVHRNVIFIAGLVTLGFLVTNQVNRFRALSRYYEGRS
jgi:serine/threonine-protein kinase